MLLIQLVLVLFFTYALSRVVTRRLRGEVTIPEALLRAFIWIIGGFIVLLPSSTTYVAHLFGVGRGVDLVIYVALTIIFFILFRLMVRLEKLNKDITNLTRAIALKPTEKTDKKV